MEKTSLSTNQIDFVLIDNKKLKKSISVNRKNNLTNKW